MDDIVEPDVIFAANDRAFVGGGHPRLERMQVRGSWGNDAAADANWQTSSGSRGFLALITSQTMAPRLSKSTRLKNKTPSVGTAADTQ